MQDITESILFGFKEILNYHTMKLVLLIGVVVTLVWSLIGYFLWDGLVGISSSVIDLVPFSMIRSNSAWMFASLLWFALVIITFSLILIFFGNMILEKVSKEKYSSFSLSIAFGSAFFWGLIGFFNADTLHIKLSQLLNFLPFKTVESSMAYLLAFYFIYSAIIVTMLIATSFFSESLLTQVSRKHFPYDGDLLKENELEISENRLKDLSIYTIVSLLSFPLLFIPLLNFIIQITLWVWLIKDTFVKDSAVLLVPKEKGEKIKEYKKGFFIISSVTALFNFLPLFNLFGPFFGEISMFYYMKLLAKKV